MINASAEQTISSTRLTAYAELVYCGRLANSTGCSVVLRRYRRWPLMSANDTDSANSMPKDSIAKDMPCSISESRDSTSAMYTS